MSRQVTIRKPRYKVDHIEFIKNTALNVLPVTDQW